VQPPVERKIRARFQVASRDTSTASRSALLLLIRRVRAGACSQRVSFKLAGAAENCAINARARRLGAAVIDELPSSSLWALSKARVLKYAWQVTLTARRFRECDKS
jgi:hypothetical protein